MQEGDVVGVGGRHEAALLVLPGEERTRSCGTNTSSKITTPSTGPYLAENFAAASPGRPARRATIVTPGVDGNRAADGEVGVLGGVGAAGHDEELVHVRRARHDGLRATDDDAVGTALGNVDVDVGVGLLAGRLSGSPLASVIATPSVRSRSWTSWR